MLLRFGVANHLSICGRQELTLVASSLKDRDDGLIASEFAPRGVVLPAALIYGANASGKSNLLDALSTMRRMVLESGATGNAVGGVRRNAFRLDPTCADAPTCFDIDFVVEGIRYSYGFEAADQAFTTEWLHQFPRSHRRLMFDRRNGQSRFGRWLKGPNSNIAKLTKPNSLFLSVAAQNDHPQLTKIHRYFRTLDLEVVTSHSEGDVSRQIGPGGIGERTIRFLELLNTGVVGHRVHARRGGGGPDPSTAGFRQSGHLEGGPDVPADPAGENTVVELAHQGQAGQSFHFDLNMESAGTRRLLTVLDGVFKALDSGSVLCVDGLESSLHTHVGEAILVLFCSRETNPNGAQLIATTHDTNLLASAAIRRDQIWFVEKSPAGFSQVYPLTDFRTRRGDNIQLGYLQGRYGAVPPDLALSLLAASS